MWPHDTTVDEFVSKMFNESHVYLVPFINNVSSEVIWPYEFLVKRDTSLHKGVLMVGNVVGSQQQSRCTGHNQTMLKAHLRTSMCSTV